MIYRDAISDRHYTYAAVQDAARNFGEGLLSQWKWQRNDVLTLFAPNSIDMPVVIYGTFFAGGIVSPANPNYSADELGFQVTDNGCKAIATTESLLPVATAAARKASIPLDRIILIDDARSNQFRHFDQIVKASPGESYQRVKVDPDNALAFLVYSSGTTGLPKGVMLSHLNVVSDILMISSSVGKHYSWNTDRFIGLLPFYHIYGMS